MPLFRRGLVARAVARAATAWARRGAASRAEKVDETTVKRLAEQAKMEEKVWDVLVPERNLNVLGCGLLVAAIFGANYYQRKLVAENEVYERRHDD